MELLAAYGIPEVWDKFTEDFDATSGLISGWSSDDLPAMGKVFGKSRVKDQFFAHWSLFQVLASAPPEAEATCARREAVTQVHLTQLLSDRLVGSRSSDTQAVIQRHELSLELGRTLREVGS